MARGGGTGARGNKKKKADGPLSQQNGVGAADSRNGPDAAGDKHKTTQKHNRRQKEDTPPVIQQHEEEQPQKDPAREKLVPTSEQLRLAQIIQGNDTNKDPQRKAKINQIMEITGKTEDDVATALFDTNWDETKAIELLLEGGMGSWEETGKKKTKKSDKDETSRENEDFNDDFDPVSDNRERSRGRGGPRLRGGRGGRGGDHRAGGESDWKHRENQENERNFEGGRGRGGRGMAGRGRGGHVGMAPRGQRPGRGGGPRGGGPGRPGGEGPIGQIDTWNPIGSEKQQDERQRMRNNKDAFDNAGNWGDDFPAAEDWDNDEYTGSLADSKVFTPSGANAGKAVGQPVNGSAAGHPKAVSQANNSMSYSQSIDLNSLLNTGGLRDYNAAASQDLKTAIGIGGGSAPGKPGQGAAPGQQADDNGLSPGGGHYSGPSLSYSSGANQGSFNSAAPGSAFSPIKPAAVTNGSADRGKSMPRARLPPPSRIPQSAVEMPGAGGDGSLSNLDVQFGGMDLQFGGGGGGSTSSNNDLEFNAAPGKGMSSSTTPSKDGSYVHSIQSSGGKDDSYKAASSSLAPGAVKDVNQSLSSALSAAAGMKTGGSDASSVPGYGRGANDSSGGSQPRSADKYGPTSSQRSPGPLLGKSDNLGYGSSQSGYPYQSGGSGGKSGYNSYSSSGQGYDRQNSSSGYAGSNGLNSSYGGGSGGSSSYNSGSGQSGSYSSNNTGFNSSQQANNFGSGYGAVTTTAGYSSFSSNNSYSGKSSSATTAGSSYLTSGTTVSSLSQYTASNDTTVSQSKSSYDNSQSSAAGLGLSSVTNSSKMSVNTTQGNKLVPGMPPGVAGVLPAQYMTPAGFPAYLAAGLGQPAAAMYGYGGHQLEDLAALQRSTLAASLPQLVGNSAATGTAGTANNAAVGQSAKGFGAGTSGQSAGGAAVPTSVASGARQDQSGQNSFTDNKFSGTDSTSSPVPSTVGSNSVGQQPAPFNLASSFTAAAAQHPTLPPGYAYFYGGMPGLQYGGGVAGGGVYPGPHTGIPVPTAAGPTSTSQFQNKAAYGSSYGGTGYDSLSLGQSSSGYVNNKYGSDNSQGKAGSSATGAGTGAYWSSALW